MLQRDCAETMHMLQIRKYISQPKLSTATLFLTRWGHEAYLRTGPHYDFEHYKQLVHEITKAFSGISKEVLEIKEQLHQDFDRPDLSEHMEKLQIKEKEKLELTAKLQLAKQNVQDHPANEDFLEKVQQLKQDVIKNKAVLADILQDFKYDSEEPE
ncbi:required for excision 1-B domain-containing protein-like isoform X1 [Triplophysa rosa]|uniref:required for excision 1-B domain-containing protein-like isoform X1 n=1 Tax=Triplophysa rosa TaxID=992332 RepID=UPI0025463400|nr:required for excision 1-B domain-containing protein-like isoform X1 [Triplophysa rosa]